MRVAFARNPAAAVAVTFAVLLYGTVSAKDLGIRGETWAIAEPDLLQVLEARLQELERSGDLAKLEDEARARARVRVEVPEPVAGIAPAVRRHSRRIDPSVVLDRDVHLANGRLLAAAGTRLNPLEHVPLHRDLLFIDGRREAEVDWALEHAEPSTIVLLAGRPLDLARRHGRSFFFDQGGRFATRFGLAGTPVLVEQEGLHLRLTEVPVPDQEGEP